MDDLWATDTSDDNSTPTIKELIVCSTIEGFLKKKACSAIYSGTLSWEIYIGVICFYSTDLFAPYNLGKEQNIFLEI